ncbi:hypothetical protein BHE74_00027888 [Ensete ventricosum]|uniref:Uncharacterized protein n=1 Tax=Ensete ventricosum TaxID=4639 RepID=A0A426Y7T6_ENSVE|nr:hypothetical protein B296_00024094 [Ensete ventricosum]RWW18793.1 hypothetical protein GW17_00017198 [Ensete ventricosum]RWW64843.1 hypothetical protein BHE74_00027888 [Ensete ventricosum]RZS06931.1 hypothetical protein BHM03_00037669 [Ensete ventricosum]
MSVMVQSTGTFTAVARYASATPVPPSVLSRGIGWQVGVSSLENAGLLALTRVGSRRVVQISAGFMIFFSILGAGGLSFLQFCNLNSFRTKFILGFSVFMGLSVPQYFNEYTSVAGYGPVHTGARWPFVAGFVAFFLDNSLHRHDSAVRKDRGLHWWHKFRSYKGDPRSEEFYRLPLNLNKFFPAD